MFKRKYISLAAGMAFILTGIAAGLFYTVSSLGTSVDAQSVLEDVCSYNADHYDMVSTNRMKGQTHDGDQDYTLVIKGRRSPDGFHWLGQVEDYEPYEAGSDNPHEPAKSELIWIDAVGKFDRVATHAYPDRWRAWEVEYFTDRDKQARINNQTYYMGLGSTERFCGATDLKDLKYTGEVSLRGETVKHFTASRELKASDGYSPGDYENYEYWIDDGKLFRVQIETRWTAGGGELKPHLLTITDYENYGVPNVITAPDIP